jgi:hypothetical protein
MRYLSKPGHPVHDVFTNPEGPQIIPAQDIQDEVDNVLFRAKLLVRAMTVSHHLISLASSVSYAITIRSNLSITLKVMCLYAQRGLMLS